MDPKFEVFKNGTETTLKITYGEASLEIPASWISKMERALEKTRHIRSCACGYCATSCGKQDGNCVCGCCYLDCWG